jgi:hypothetical protein
VQALKLNYRKPHREMCPWNQDIKEHLVDHPSVFSGDTPFEPTPEEPVVFHLHGNDDLAASLVLIEDDYFDFLINQEKKILPRRIERALAGTSLLFMGYAISDWSFRVLFRSLVSYLPGLGLAHVSVQIAPGKEEVQKRKVEEYLTRYYGTLNIRVYWGDCREFATELRQRWDDFKNGK